MDIKIVNLKTKKIEENKKIDKIKVYKILEKYFFDILGLTIIDTDYCLEKDQKNIVEVLALDEDYRLVIVEYRFGKFSRTIGQALMQMDYINNNQSQIQMLVVEKMGSEHVHEINYKPRLIVLSESFNSYDFNAINKLPYTIEAITYSFIGDNLVLVKQYQSRSIDHFSFSFKFTTNSMRYLYDELNDFVLSLGDEVIEYGYNNILSYRKIRNFMYVVLKDKIQVYIGKKEYIINNNRDLEKIKPLIEKVYDAH